MRNGTYPHPKGYPLAAGIEFSGIVVECGSAVKSISVGYRVAGFSEGAGAFSEFICIEESLVVELHKDLKLEDGAAYFVQTSTAYHLLHTISDVRKNSFVLIHAIGGGVGLNLVQLAKIAGATVIGTVGTAGKEQKALDCGADLVINRNEKDFVKEISQDFGKNCIELGFTSVMMDGSLLDDQKTPSDFDYNVRVTKETTDMAHALGVSVEGEIGCLGSLETGTGEKEDGVGAEGKLDHDQLLTDPNEASDFVKATNVDALAIAIGTSHGAYKFSRPPTGDILAIDRIKEIHSRLPNTHLVMHGSSSVPQDLIKTINEYGGKIKETYGVPVSEIQEGIKHGVRKVNVDTDLRLAATAAVRKYFHENPSQFDPRKYLLLSKDAMKEVVKNRLQEFGTAGNASSINSLSLGEMATKYKSGDFKAVIN